MYDPAEDDFFGEEQSGCIVPGQELGFSTTTTTTAPTPAFVPPMPPSSASSSTASLISFAAAALPPRQLQQPLSADAAAAEATTTIRQSPSPIGTPTVQRCQRCMLRLEEMRATLSQRCQNGAMLWERNWAACDARCFGACDSVEFCTEHGWPLPECLARYAAVPGVKHSVVVYQGTWVKLRRKRGQLLQQQQQQQAGMIVAAERKPQPRRKRARQQRHEDEDFAVVMPATSSSVALQPSDPSSPSTVSPMTGTDTPLSPGMDGSVTAMHPAGVVVVAAASAMPPMAASEAAEALSSSATAAGSCSCAERLQGLIDAVWVRGNSEAEDKLRRHLSACSTVCQGFCKTPYCCRLHWCPAFVLKDGTSSKYHCQGGVHGKAGNKGRHHADFCYYCSDPACCGGKWYSRDETHKRTTTKRQIAAASAAFAGAASSVGVSVLPPVALSQLDPAMRVTDSVQDAAPSAPPLPLHQGTDSESSSSSSCSSSASKPSASKPTATSSPESSLTATTTSSALPSKLATDSQETTAALFQVPPPAYSTLPNDSHGDHDIVEIYPRKSASSSPVHMVPEPDFGAAEAKSQRQPWMLPLMSVLLSVSVAALLCCLVFVGTLSAENQRQKEQINFCWSLSYRSTNPGPHVPPPPQPPSPHKLPPLLSIPPSHDVGAGGGALTTTTGCNECILLPDTLKCSSAGVFGDDEPSSSPVVLQLVAERVYVADMRSSSHDVVLTNLRAWTNFSSAEATGSELRLPLALSGATTEAVQGWEDTWFAFVS